MSEIITITQIVDAIKKTLKADDGGLRAQSGVELGDGIADTPTLQVYWDAENTDAESQNDRTTFGGGVQQSGITINADVLVHERGEIGENMAAVQTMAETIRRDKDHPLNVSTGDSGYRSTGSLRAVGHGVTGTTGGVSASRAASLSAMVPVLASMPSSNAWSSAEI